MKRLQNSDNIHLKFCVISITNANKAYYIQWAFVEVATFWHLQKLLRLYFKLRLLQFTLVLLQQFKNTVSIFRILNNLDAPCLDRGGRAATQTNKQTNNVFPFPKSSQKNGCRQPRQSSPEGRSDQSKFHFYCGRRFLLGVAFFYNFPWQPQGLETNSECFFFWK